MLILAVAVGGLAPSAEAALPPFPTFTGAELKAFYYASQPLPGTQRITTRPPIYGNAAADRRIQQLAEARGYRLQVTPTVPLGSYGGVTLAADAGRAWVALLDAARRHGTPLQGNSGYRSIETQREIFRRRLGGWSPAQIASGAADGAIDGVLSYHSIPGYSRHHTGKTLDLSAAGGSNGSFAATAAYRWLSADNYRVAKTYGFIPNYPPGAGAQGPNPEPWEFVYVGADRIRCAIDRIPLADPEAHRICGIPDQPIVGELTGDGIDDVLLYRPGVRQEHLYPGTRSRSQTTRTGPSVTGRYIPVVGDFRGTGMDDVLWYGPVGAPDSLWRFSPGGGHTSQPVAVGGIYRPVVGDFDGSGTDDIFWHAPGAAADWIWYHRADGSYRPVRSSVSGTYTPVAGDVDGDGVDDIIWYAPGAAADSVWLQRPDGSHRTAVISVSGRYAPVAGDFDGNGVDDVLWYAAGSAADFVWYHQPGGAVVSRATQINGHYTVGTGDHDDDGYDDVVFVAPEGGADAVWFGQPSGFSRMARIY